MHVQSKAPRRGPKRASKGTTTQPSEEKGRLSNPVQHRLSASEVEGLASRYIDGLSINELANHYGVHRTTILYHLKARDIDRRRNIRKLTDAQVGDAAKR